MTIEGILWPMTALIGTVIIWTPSVMGASRPREVSMAVKEQDKKRSKTDGTMDGQMARRCARIRKAHVLNKRQGA